MHYRSRKYTVCGSVHPSFNPEILQAGAVKGLVVNMWCVVRHDNCNAKGGFGLLGS